MIVDPFDTLGILARANQAYLERKADVRLENHSESSMSYDAKGETLYGKIRKHYAGQVSSSTAIQTIINDIKQYCRQAFNQHHPDLLFDIPSNLTTHAANLFNGQLHPSCKDCQRLKIYLENSPHTAFRMLSNPNPLINRYALHAAGRYGQKTHISISDVHIKKIAYFWLAASDKNAECIEGYVPKNLKDLFIQALALIGRAHNWDKERLVTKTYKNNDGKLYTRKIREEYDDGHLDTPSCQAGIDRRLNQSLIGHRWFQQQRPFIGQYLIVEVTSLIHQVVYTHLSIWKDDFNILDALISNYVIEIFPKNTSYHEFVDSFIEDCCQYGIEHDSKIIQISKSLAEAFGVALKAIHRDILRGFRDLDEELLLRAEDEYKHQPITEVGHSKGFKSFHDFFSKHLQGIQPNQLHVVIAKNLDAIRKNQKNSLIMQIQNQQERQKAFERVSRYLILSIDLSESYWFTEEKLAVLIDQEPLLAPSDKEAIINYAQGMMTEAVPDYSILPYGQVNGRKQLKVPGDGDCLFTSFFLACLDEKINLHEQGIEHPKQLREKVAKYIKSQYKTAKEIIADMIQILKNYCPHQDDAVIDVQQDYNLAKAEGRRLLTQISTGSTPAQIRGFLRNFAKFLFPDERSIESFVAQFCEAIDYINRLYEAYHEYNESFGCHLTNVGDYISQIAKKGNWGGEFEIDNACKLLNISAVITRQGQGFYHLSVNENEQHRKIHLLHCNGNHYHALVNSNEDSALLHALAVKDVTHLLDLDRKASVQTKQFAKKYLSFSIEALKEKRPMKQIEEKFKALLSLYQQTFISLKEKLENNCFSERKKMIHSHLVAVDPINDTVDSLCTQNLCILPLRNNLHLVENSNVRTIQGLSLQDVFFKHLTQKEKNAFLLAEHLELMQLSAEVETKALPFIYSHNGWDCYVIQEVKINIYANSPTVVAGRRQPIASMDLYFNGGVHLEHNLSVIPLNNVGGRAIHLNTWKMRSLVKNENFVLYANAARSSLDTFLKTKKHEMLSRKFIESLEYLELQYLERELGKFSEYYWISEEMKTQISMLPSVETIRANLRTLVYENAPLLEWPKKTFDVLHDINFETFLHKNLFLIQNMRKAYEYVAKNSSSIEFEKLKEDQNKNDALFFLFNHSTDAVNMKATYDEASENKKSRLMMI